MLPSSIPPRSLNKVDVSYDVESLFINVPIDQTIAYGYFTALKNYFSDRFFSYEDFTHRSIHRKQHFRELNKVKLMMNLYLYSYATDSENGNKSYRIKVKIGKSGEFVEKVWLISTE